MTSHLLYSFKQHEGQRGVHFYDETSCNFLSWLEVFSFVKELSDVGEAAMPFSEQLFDSLANYDPDTEFLAVQQTGNQVSVELYTELSRGKTFKRT
jgi:hypothetical protein